APGTPDGAHHLSLRYPTLGNPSEHAVDRLPQTLGRHPRPRGRDDPENARQLSGIEVRVHVLCELTFADEAALQPRAFPVRQQVTEDVKVDPLGGPVGRHRPGIVAPRKADAIGQLHHLPAGGSMTVRPYGRAMPPRRDVSEVMLRPTESFIRLDVA